MYIYIYKHLQSVSRETSLDAISVRRCHYIYIYTYIHIHTYIYIGIGIHLWHMFVYVYIYIYVPAARPSVGRRAWMRSPSGGATHRRLRSAGPKKEEKEDLGLKVPCAPK